MRKLVSLFVVIVSLIAMSISCFAENWEYVTKNTNGSEYYIDRDSAYCLDRDDKNFKCSVMVATVFSEFDSVDNAVNGFGFPMHRWRGRASHSLEKYTFNDKKGKLRYKREGEIVYDSQGNILYTAPSQMFFNKLESGTVLYSIYVSVKAIVK